VPRGFADILLDGAPVEILQNSKLVAGLDIEPGEFGAYRSLAGLDADFVIVAARGPQADVEPRQDFHR